MSTLKVVFDTNAFHGDAFELLEKSDFRRLCKAGKITPVYGHVFIEESMRAYGMDKRRTDLLDRWLPLIIATAKTIGEDFVHIWREEVIQGRGKKAWPFMRPDKYERFKHGVARLPRDGVWHGFAKTEAERELENQKRASQHATFREMRADIAAFSKANPGALKAAKKTFEPSNLSALEVEAFGRMLIGHDLPCKNPSSVANRWATDRAAYPFFTQFAENMVYASHFAMMEHNEKIDINAQADLDLLTHLLHSQVVVSNETGFLKSAFDALWRPRKKILLTSAEFVTLTNRM